MIDGPAPPSAVGDATPQTTAPAFWRRRSVRALTLIAAIGAVAGSTWWLRCGGRGCPSPEALRTWRPSIGGAVHARDGAVIGTLALVRRMPVGTREMPRHVRDAFIATEDRRFRTHGGVDWRGVARAAWVNVRHLGVREGASTITMQLARLMFLGGGARDESLARKLLEVRYAGLLEAALSKEQILTHYLNTVYLGDGAFGVEAASRSYFGHGIAKATRAEAALLAGLAQAPSSYSPRSHPDRAARRQREVLARLVRDSVIDSVTAARITLDDVRLVDGGTTTALVRAPASWATEAARATVDSLRRATALPAWATDDALTLRTTIDARAQRAAERAVARGAAALDHRRAPWETPDATRRTQGALVALDPATGAIRAIVGGRRLERAAFDRARRARRSVGSAFKPFVYAAAMADTMTPATMVADTPVELTVGNDIWRPTNFGDDYAGPITLRDALAQSANAAAVRVAQQVGIAQVRTMAQRAGITATLPNVPALALGAAQLTPLELTAAYAVFANGGQRVTPLLVTRIEDAFGRTLWEAPSSPPRPALDPREAFLVQSLMRSVVDEGTARAVRAAGVRGPVAGKTGTTNDATDVWFVGMTPTLVAGVWFGSDTPTPLADGASGGRDAAPVWASFLLAGWHSPERDTPWRAPAGLERRRIDIATGLVADDWCGESRLEWFKAGTAPTRSCHEGNPLGEVADVEPEMPEPEMSRPEPVPPRPPGASDDWLRAMPEVLRGDRLPTREELASAAKDLDRLRAAVMAELQRAQREAERAQREAERQARRSRERARQESRRLSME